MPDDPKVNPFSEIPPKAAAPAKKSLFERQKAEAEAKRAREKAETAAVYEDFVKSFENDEDSPTLLNTASRTGGYQHGSGQPVGGPARRHFTSASMKSSAIGGLGPPPSSFTKKRTYDGYLASSRDHTGRGILTYENSSSAMDTTSAFRILEDEEEKTMDKKEAERAAAKPTLHLSSLPPGTSPAVIKALIPPVLAVDNVKIIPPASQATGERKIWSAIVTLAKETAATDMDTVVSSLQNKYLGWGFYLSISRHLSSAAINSAIPVTPGLTGLTSQPFGARPTPHGPGVFSRGPPGPHRSAFAPPTSYAPNYGTRDGSAFQVDVKPPSDLKQLKLIHKTLENLLTYGPEFEALLMGRPEVQREEKWAWIWNSRSVGGVWYRWKLWDILTNSAKSTNRNRLRGIPTYIFENGPGWVAPEKKLAFEFTTKLDQFVSDEDYDSSDEDDSDRDDERRINDPSNEPNDGTGHLNPLHKAKLAHLLARLPTTNTKLRRGDVARITAFAINHAGEGGEEVVDLIISNVKYPFAYSAANPERQQDETEMINTKTEEAAEPNEKDMEGPENTDRISKIESKERLDISPSKLVGLYIISDILSSSSTSGVRHAWRYRQLFETALKARKVFEHLGRLEKDLGWGRLKLEKWRRSIGSLLSLWEGWCVFPQSSHEHFVQVFERPPLTKKELEEEKARAEVEKAPGLFGTKDKSKWKTVEDAGMIPAVDKYEPSPDGDKMDIDIDGAPIAGEEEMLDVGSMSDIDGVPMEDSDLEDTEALAEGEEALVPQDKGPNVPAPEKEADTSLPSSSEPPMRRRRPKAEDMFADSDSD
ncbi:hypothetical protein LOZ12_000110 [Ophidiomyces ophidiicola]|uniref:Uncharacterized protein n=1 Tax=Ophidiomyces ophidiicola TaxID=1387563 RepID=A0ACB8V5A4_9EURO|nr:uncharacterized protein LOZ57_003106 [Ophidiomyces ophidiicola]KAI1908161.1 hypothetical protein LOZ61_005725 [Ophidiomyces ophidiicola]KAI1923650.1 hypothetical protein LOZ64_000909 [Ophidiomyces ophidiicola]KAI1925951.1 hypothetical protein LOZ60_003840 [Ophidiomyces ophidiicola]KAI1947954.1 hypothetical protein LOZ57_003106 [Ophidiomyces ophidiicola]KAI1956098.1 hypothetical protein LOZ62_000090 [Ophidiomyces ophidiicola]